MLACVVISYVEVGSAGKRISQEEGVYRLIPSSTNVTVEAVAERISEEEDEVNFFVTSSSDVVAVCVMKLSCAIVSSSSRVSLAESVWMSSYDCSP
jgi:hypothetical protein